MIEPLPAIVFPYTFVISVVFVRQHKTIQIMCHLAVIALARYVNKIDTVSPLYDAVNAQISEMMRMM